MNKINTFFFILPLAAFSQTVDSTLAFYPLQTGNYWEYMRVNYNPSTLGRDTSYYSIEVIGDTIMSNNIQYKVLIKKSIPDTLTSVYFFERVDSITCNTYLYSPGYPNYEALQDSLKAQLGDTIHNSWRGQFAGVILSEILCTSVIQDSVLDFVTTIKNFKDDDWTVDYKFRLAKELGFIYEYNSFDIWDLSIIYLMFAKINGVSHGIPLSIKHKTMPIPQFFVYQNYPNPFNFRTVIPFELQMAQNIEINIFDPSGKEIFTLFKGRISEGYHELTVDGNNLASGIYYYQIRSKNYSQTKKLILLK